MKVKVQELYKTLKLNMFFNIILAILNESIYPIGVAGFLFLKLPEYELKAMKDERYLTYQVSMIFTYFTLFSIIVILPAISLAFFILPAKYRVDSQL